MKEEWVGSRRRRFCSEIWGNAISGGGAYENPVGLSMYDGPIKTVEYMLVNIWCMLDWIVGFCYKTAETHFLGVQ